MQFSSYSDFIARMQREIEEKSEHLPDPEKPFTENESKEWLEKLDAMAEKFEELRQANEVQESELRKVKEEVQSLKDQITILPKRTWLKSFGYKFVNAFSDKMVDKSGEKLADSFVNLLTGPSNGA